MTRRDHEQRPEHRVGWWRVLDLIGPDRRTFLRRRGVDLRLFGVYLHHIDAPDPGMDLHDHPWPFVSVILRGGYTETAAEVLPRGRDDLLVCPGCGCAVCSHRNDGCRWHPLCLRPGLLPASVRRWRRGSVHRMPLTVAHRITATEPGTVSLVIRGRKVRRWGFYMPIGWVDWADYDYDARRPVRERGDALIRPEAAS